METKAAPLKVLLADGDRTFVDAAAKRFRDLTDVSASVDVCPTGKALLDLVYSYPYDLILLDSGLRDDDALEILARLSQTTLPLPVIILAAADDARLAVEAMKRGVLDIIMKDDFLTLDLPGLLRRLAETFRLRRENAELQQINQMKNDFLATISHELRTPLTSILGLSEVLVSGRMGELEKRQGQSLKKILEQSQNLVRLINQLLDIRALTHEDKKLARETVSLSALARERTEAVRPLFHEKGVSLECVVPEGSAEILGDRESLVKVLDNLVSNALKFTPKGGQVALEVGTAEGGRVQARIKDSGRGIPPEALPYVFQKFYHVDQSLTRAYSGMGLGLAFCKEVVEAHGGRIWAESRGVDQGTTVCFLLPKAEPFRVPAASPDGPRLILWVDDNPNMLELVEYGIASMSRAITLKTARGGLPALEILKTDTPSLIVLDIMMSDMDGLEVLERLKAEPRTARVPVLVVSGYREAAKSAMRRGADDYCLKPFRVTDVVRKIEALLFPATGS